MARYHVRSLYTEDFEIIMQLERELFGEDAEGTLGPYYVRLCCEFFADSCFVLEAGGVPAGYLLSFTKNRVSYCTTLAILPEYQGSRVVIRLLKAYIQSIASKVDSCWFTVEPGNQAARALHKVLGATETEIRENFYGSGSPRIISKIDRNAFERTKAKFAKLGLVENKAPQIDVACA